MTYYGGKELAASFRTVRGNTIKIAEEIPENKYDFRAAPDCRTIGKTLVHVTLGPSFQIHIQGNKITDLSKVNFDAEDGCRGSQAAHEGRDRYVSRERRRQIHLVS